MLTFIIVSSVLVLIYLNFIKPFKYWKERGIPYVKPVPFLGNYASAVFQQLSATEVIDVLYNSYPDLRYCGIYQLTLPTLMIRDPELIGKITFTEFASFPDHRNIVSKETDPLWGNGLFAMRKQDGWLDTRFMVSPAFTNSKLKQMLSSMQICVDQFISCYIKGDIIVEVELKDATTRLSNDIIATTAFGVTCNSLKHKKNMFYLMSKDAATVTGWRLAKSFGYVAFPTLMRFFSIKVFNKNVSKFFGTLIKETIKYRKEKNIVRPDLIHFLMQANKDNLNRENCSNNPVDSQHDKERTKKKKINLTDEKLTAVALNFLLAGYETISTLVSYTFYELALNPDIQRKLHEEIEQTIGDAKTNYEDLIKMQYLHSIISETLRKWTPTPATDRLCVKEFKIEPERAWEEPLYLDKGMGICIPIRSIHMDPKFHPNPLKFDPDRFNADNARKIKPFTYMPFGLGQRSCIGSRFGLLESKLIIVEVIKIFEIVPIKRTPIPIVFSKKNIHPLPDEGIWVGLKLRSD